MAGRIAGLGVVALLAVGCGPAYQNEEGDRFYGVVDATPFDAKFAPATGTRCPPGVSRCYPAQRVSLRGQTTAVYNLGAVASGLTFGAGGTLAPSTVRSAPYAYHFPTSCQAREGNTLAGYENTAQFPIFSGLPLATTSPTAPPVLPFVRVLGVSDLSGNGCNALKRVASVEAGRYGARPAEPASATPSLWAVIDPSAQVVPLRAGSQFTPGLGWFKGLLLSYLDGGPLPLDGGGAVRTMEGVLVSPATGTPTTPTDDRALILSFGPGEAGYSPVVRLRRFNAAAGRAPSSYTALCSSANPALPACTGAANEVNLELVNPTIVFTTFLVASTL